MMMTMMMMMMMMMKVNIVGRRCLNILVNRGKTTNLEYLMNKLFLFSLQLGLRVIFMFIAGA